MATVKCGLFCAKLNRRDRRSRNFELRLARQTSEGEEKYCGGLATFLFGTFTMSFTPLGVLLVMKTLKLGWYVVIKVTDLENFFIIHMHCVSALH